jgi:endonuclease-3 related protein
VTRNISNRLTSAYKKLYKAYGPQGWWPADAPFEVIVGAILTQNTAWTNVEKAIENLKKAKLLSPKKLKSIPLRSLASLIRPAGYYNIKARRLKNFVSFLYSEYGGSIKRLSSERSPALRGELLGINGVGPETCDSIMLYALGKPSFVVDAYTRRVFSRHSHFASSAGYHDIQKYFMDNLPKNIKLYNEYHALIVRLAKEHCRTKPDCKNCPLYTDAV